MLGSSTAPERVGKVRVAVVGDTGSGKTSWVHLIRANGPHGGSRGAGAARSAVRAVGADEVDPGGLTGARVADDGDADLPDPLRCGRRPEHRKLALSNSLLLGHLALSPFDW